MLFRLLLAAPHLLWAWIFGTAALAVSVIVWLAVLFERRAPGSLHRFVASYVRYSTHLSAYLSLAANPYPGFTGGSAYPVDVEIDPPARQGRVGAGFRLVLALPALLLASAVGGSSAIGMSMGTWFFFGLVTAVSMLGWFASLVLGRMPRGLRDAATFGIGYSSRTLSYLLLLTDRYPNAAPGQVDPPPDLPEHPIAIVVDDDLRRPRLLVAFRGLLVVPHFLWLTLWTVPAALAALLAWVLALALGRVPRFLHRFLAAFVRQSAHVTAFLYLVGRPFPGFVGREGSYPIAVTIAQPARQRRLGVLVRILLALPAVIVSSAYATVVFLLGVLAWFAGLATGRMPSGLRDLGAAAIRYEAQLYAYVFLLTSRYPDASPMLAGREPAEELAEQLTS